MGEWVLISLPCLPACLWGWVACGGGWQSEREAVLAALQRWEAFNKQRDADVDRFKVAAAGGGGRHGYAGLRQGGREGDRKSVV